ncbi:HK97 gp10 family phage protein [Rhodospirillum sp. A1_3_36]|uniref:HK97 gp10 family phage protein n=1 Tax=Rhodospirillum sp. A1_3_36 TaxID=3391666 RepID=UPI0039A68A81
MRRLPNEIRDEVKEAIADSAEAVRLDIIANAPEDEGDLKRSVAAKFSSDKLAVYVGPGARGAMIQSRRTGSPFATRTDTGKKKISPSARKDLMQFFKAYWLERGTRGGTITEWNGQTLEHPITIPPLPALRFIERAWDGNREWAKQRINAAVRNALDKVVRRR